MRTANRLCLCALLLLAVSCWGRKKAAPAAKDRAFPQVVIPVAYTDPDERISYALEHYWDGFFGGDGRTDSARVLGVPKGEVEQALANYIGVLGRAPLPQAGKAVSGLFDALAAKQAADSSNRVYLAMTEMVARYLYDPNSPLRDEDLYLPFVQKMAASPLTKEDMRTAYRYEAQMCALNPRGSVAPDFVMTLRGGTQVRMHSVRAERTLLFFSNPGCHNCKEIIDALQADGNILNLIREGRLAVLNIYIDEDLDAWRSYMPIYPKEWLNGYDAAHILRQDVLYNIRAIPSLYLLDAEKRILLKDAPLERVQEALIF
ncbi:MAG: DUF5106 domain-containing protein [Bacteroidales bacterium]|nr:DUF5106 domain-containing protein [Bacteroidales bacterium]